MMSVNACRATDRGPTSPYKAPMRPTESTVIGLALITMLACADVTRGASQGVGLAIGDSILRPDNRPWSQDTLSAFIIAPNCQSCAYGEKEFDDRVQEYCEAHSWPVLYVVGVDSPAQREARELERLHRTVLRLDLKAAGLLRLPTILRVNSRGVIKSMWTGVVPRDERDKALRTLISVPNVESYDRISDEEFRTRRLPASAQLVALSSRVVSMLQQRAQQPAIIPILRLASLAPRQLLTTRDTYILCSTAEDVTQCQDAAIILARSGFRKIYAVGLPTRPITRFVQ